MTSNRRFSLARRRGITLAECGVVYSITLLLTMGTLISGFGIFRFQQVASLARQGARWASVHGPVYQQENGTSAITSAAVMTNAIASSMVGLNPANLTCTLSIPTSTTSPSTGTVTVSADGTAVTSTTNNATLPNSGCATVTVTYQWIPEGFFSPITLTSTAVAPITY